MVKNEILVEGALKQLGLSAFIFGDVGALIQGSNFSTPEEVEEFLREQVKIDHCIFAYYEDQEGFHFCKDVRVYLDKLDTESSIDVIIKRIVGTDTEDFIHACGITHPEYLKYGNGLIAVSDNDMDEVIVKMGGIPNHSLKAFDRNP